MIPLVAISDAGSATTLTYSLQVNPNPLTASPAANLNLGAQSASLVFIITNNTKTPVTITSIDLNIPYGTTSGNLTGELPGTAVPANSDNSVGSPTQTTFQGANVLQYAITPAAGSSFAPGYSWYLEIPGISVSEYFGVVTITVAETIGSNTNDAAFDVPILPFGFFFTDLQATYYNQATKVTSPVVQVQYNKPVTLSWNSSVVSPSDFVVYYSSINGQVSTKNNNNPVKYLGTWTSAPLTNDTIFTVVATVPAYSGGSSLPAVLSIAVAVDTPNVSANNIAAKGTVTAGGNITTSGDITTTGEVSVTPPAYATDTTGIYMTGAVTVSGDITITTSTSNKYRPSYTYNNTMTLDGYRLTNTSTGPVRSNGQNATETYLSNYRVKWVSTNTYKGTQTRLDFTGVGLGGLYFIGRNYSVPHLSYSLYLRPLSGLVISAPQQATYTPQSVTVAASGITTVALTVNGNAITSAVPHPAQPDKLLAHAALTGPEAAVFYRGSAVLKKGRAEVVLPEYFHSVVDPDSVTIHLTPVDGFDRLAIRTKDGRKVSDGRFVVVSDNTRSAQSFDWEVKGTRRDMPALDVTQSVPPPPKPPEKKGLPARAARRITN